MLAIGTVLAELVAATDSRLRLGRLASLSSREVVVKECEGSWRTIY